MRETVGRSVVSFIKFAREQTCAKLALLASLPLFFFLTRLTCVAAFQVHLAKMKGGGDVAVKVQRGGLKALFDQDLQVKRSPTGFGGARGVPTERVLSVSCARAECD